MADKTPRPPRVWQRMLSGRRLDLLAPSPDDIEIEDIAHGLARVARWNGQTVGEHAFTVAEHSLVVLAICQAQQPEWPARWYRAALLHDAAEYVIGDLISPFKAAIGADYKVVENRLLAAVYKRFAIPQPLPGEVRVAIKFADRIAAYFEATLLAGFSSSEARQFFGDPSGISGDLAKTLESIAATPSNAAQSAFLARFAELRS